MFFNPQSEIRGLLAYYRKQNSNWKRRYKYPYRLFASKGIAWCGEIGKSYQTLSNCDHELFSALQNTHPQGTHLPCLFSKGERDKPILQELLGSHLLVAGMTQHGKSTWLRSMLISLVHWAHPEYLRICIADAKGLAFSCMKNIANLAVPTNRSKNKMEQIEHLLHNLHDEMSRRMDLLTGTNFESVKSYNAHVYRRRGKDGRKKVIPYIVFVFDEYADFILQSDTAHQVLLNTLVSRGLGFGIQVILTLQNPYAEVLKGMIKGNLSKVMSFRLARREQEQVVFGSCGKETNTLSLPPGHFQTVENGKRVTHRGYFSTPQHLHNAVKNWQQLGLNFSMFPKQPNSP